ncbi:copper resistance protein CopC [Phycicoccus sp. MAQZ13P-2]|uniref:copper resistance CopC family protein n=1 Tax=Phycicoccus mangrovi TaxID=2840470 RepID=UPI001BFFED57|nr:copper resistance CopC family protein [Phycicoccus mangrovi]MBT9258067.1 copper resistance protein CopC [Phycicoccus mangrovi]MBT9276278.1 copper resistance protein CopC [Phycicoccus mangrovi]
MTPRAPGRRRVPRLLAVVLLLLGLAVVTATPAAAHTGLESSTPADGSTLRRSPTTLVLRFADPVVPGTAVGALSGPGGRTSLRAPTVRGATVRMTLAEPAAPGRYRLAWRVVADDGHPVSGTLRFEVAGAPAASPSPEPTSSEAVAAPPSPPSDTAPSAPEGSAVDALAAVEGAGAGDSTTTPTAGGPMVAWALLAALVALGAAGPAVLRRRTVARTTS